ncbi:MAG TPA: hypothetical protein VJH94_02520 [Candidatus Paceibacterota bacterium]
MKFIIIDPNPERRELMKSALARMYAGSGAVEVPRFSDAPAVVFDHPDTDMVFITNNTPTKRGVETAQQIKSAFPHLKVVLTGEIIGEKEARALGLDGSISTTDFSLEPLASFLKEKLYLH